MAALSIVLTTVPTEEKGAEIARTLVAEGRCACINLVPGLRSFYVWEGKAQDDREALLVAKVPTRALAAYRDRMRELHPYEVPEIVALDASAVNDAYARWCEAAVR
jgi:periplasmic divalent cation tolerance protein